MRTLMPYLANNKMACVLAPLFKMLEAIFELLVPMILAVLIDRGIGSGDSSLIFICTLGLFGLALIGVTSAMTAQYFAARAAVDFSAALREALFSHIQSLSFSRLDEIGTATLLTRITSDVQLAQNGVNMFLRLFLRSPFVVFGAMFCAFAIDVQAALIFVLVIVILFAIVGGLMACNLPGLKKAQQCLDQVLSLYQENLTGVRVLRTFCREDKETAHFFEVNGELCRMQLKTGDTAGIMNPLTYVLINLGIVVLLYVSAVRVNLGSLTQGQTVALYNYMGQILVELVKLANLVVTLNRGLAGASRVAEVLEIPGGEDASAEASVDGRGVDSVMSTCESAGQSGETNIMSISNATTAEESADRYDQYRLMSTKKGGAQSSENRIMSTKTPGLRFDNVMLTYRNAKEPSLAEISFSVQPGQTVGIIGPTGAGKSSLVRLIPGFYRAMRGRVELYGKPVEEYSPEELHNLVGFVPQKSVLFSGSILENLRMGKEELSEAEAMKVLEVAQAAGVAAGKGGLQGHIETGGRNLSGGQKQRLAIARGLAASPKVLILDDSFSALDYATDKKLRDALKEHRKADPTGITLIVSQRAASIIDADKILVMDKGRLVGWGTHEELLLTCSLYKEIYDTQYEQ